jgi:hypothetical protein
MANHQRGLSAMRQLIVRDDRELRRLETAIAHIENLRPCSGPRNDCLLAALKAERDELLRITGRTGRSRPMDRARMQTPARLSA